MKKGFTLVELLVVIIIVAILAAFAIPQYMRNIERANGGKALNNIALIAQAEKMFFADNASVYFAVVNPDNNNSELLVPGGINDYVDLADVAADTTWGYSITVGAAPPSFVITAQRFGGPNNTQTITWTDQGLRAGSFVP